MKTNTKEVSKKIQAHILDNISCGDDENPLEILYSNAQAVKTQEIVSDYQALGYLAKCGDFLIYDDDIRDFLNSLGINPNNKHYDNEIVRALYYHLVGREGAKMIDITFKVD